MATESVTNDQVIKAFAGNDSSVFLAQAMAVADLIATGNHTSCAPGTVNEAGMTVFMLLDAAREHLTAEREFIYEQHRIAMMEAKA
jgi:hypothetical protein